MGAAVRLTQLLVFIAAFSGFLNLLPFPVAPATVAIDGITGVMLFGTIVFSLRQARAEAWMIFAAAATVLAVVLAVFGPEPFQSGVIAVRNLLYYIAAGAFVATAVVTREGALVIVRTVMNAGLVIEVFGCMQFAFRSVLPSWLLFSSDTQLFGYFGTDITRSTGLIGNSIVYGTFALLIFALWLSATGQPGMAPKSRARHTVATAVSGLAVVASFSRISIALALAAILAIAAWALFRRGASRAIPIASVLVAVGAVVICAVLVNNKLSKAIEGSFVIQGLFLANNASVEGSTSGHHLFTELALQSFREHPWIGVGLGTQSGASNAVIITDGFHLQTLVEGGLFLIVPLSIVFLLVMVRLITIWRRVDSHQAWLPVAMLAFLASQVFIAGFYNTGFYGKVPNLVFWILFGATVALDRAPWQPDNLVRATAKPVPHEFAKLGKR